MIFAIALALLPEAVPAHLAYTSSMAGSGTARERSVMAGDSDGGASIDRQVTADSDDCWAYDRGAMNCTDYQNLALTGQMFVGHDPYGWCYSKTGFRFLEIPLTSGYTVDSAYLDIYSKKSLYGNSPRFKIRAQYGDADAFSTRADYDARSKTTGIDWDPDISGWTSWAWRRTPDLTSVIQAVLDEGSFSLDDDLALFIEDDGSAARHEIEIGPNARLHIECSAAPNDSDGDCVSDDVDNCPTVSNPDQTDVDGDGVGDACDICPNDPLNDTEGDGICGDVDNCPYADNPDQLNTDRACIPNGDDIGEDCRANPDKDLEGDACDLDDDNDGPDANDGLYEDSEEATGCGFGATDPLTKDSDGDRAIDGYECKVGTDPNDPAQRPTCPDPTDTDGDGFSDCVEELGYGTLPDSVDTDGDSMGNDGCRDDKEIVDVDGNGQANILDLLAIAKINLAPGPWDPVSRAVVDMNKDGANNIMDVMLAAVNSVAEPHDPC